MKNSVRHSDVGLGDLADTLCPSDVGLGDLADTLCPSDVGLASRPHTLCVIQMQDTSEQSVSFRCRIPQNKVCHSDVEDLRTKCVIQM